MASYPTLSYQTLGNIEDIDARRWDALFKSDDPFVDYRYLHALEASGSVSAAQGWQPRHILLDGPEPAAMPLYLKDHSYGEYVFDWGWARAALAAGIDYYPKLVTAIPFTPASGPRLGYQEPGQIEALLRAVKEEAETLQASSWHLLFCTSSTRERLLDQTSLRQGTLPLLERHGCQFIWHNRDYTDFDTYLTQFVSRKRKGIRRERRRVQEQGVTVRRLEGEALSDESLLQFYHFYAQTYLRRGQSPYLSPEFFRLLHRQMPERLLLVMAYRDERAVGAALFIHSEETLYGRWWGGDPTIDCLHFEVCYYQGIEYAIEQKLDRFDPGTQGEHKLLRGFEPETTHSLHWIRDPRLAAALEPWLARERDQIEAYRDDARSYLPFKAEG